MSILEKLTEGIVERDLQRDSHALVEKWEKTGLLEGIATEAKKNSMACLLENQAKELLRESSSMNAGDVEGFAAVAFPIVRRVFAGLIANDLVSVQPMSLPSGLIFFLDFSKEGARLGDEADDSVYGGGRLASEITGGVSLTGGDAEKGFYNLNNGYASPTGSNGFTLTGVTSGTVGTGNEDIDKLVRHDPDLASGSAVYVGTLPIASFDQLNREDLVTVTIRNADLAEGRQARRLTQLSGTAPHTNLLVVIAASGSENAGTLNPGGDGSASTTVTASYAQTDDFTTGGAIGSVVGRDAWGLEGNANIPEIDIKVDSVAVTAQTKKLKAKWTPELGQDLNAYHNLDAEVELTSILSEQIALEIDQEILEDLIKGATAGKQYWSRRPGKFLNRDTGAPISASANEDLLGADFTGTVSEWYETLLETINDVSAQIHRKTLRGGANFLVCGPEAANILEFTAGFKANVTHDDDTGSAGAVNVGSISKKWDVFVDPYFPRNVILVGRKGNSFLESGYVYAPYVPLQTTPTIFGTEDFVPRKGVMTRYAKKMVRPDMYGLVVVTDMLG